MPDVLLHPVLEQVVPVAVFLLAITVTAEIALTTPSSPSASTPQPWPRAPLRCCWWRCSGGALARLMATLVGVNAGALVTPWASLSTLLWLQRCRADELQVPLLELAGWGALCAILSLSTVTLNIR